VQQGKKYIDISKECTASMCLHSSTLNMEAKDLPYAFLPNQQIITASHSRSLKC